MQNLWCQWCWHVSKFQKKPGPNLARRVRFAALTGACRTKPPDAQTAPALRQRRHSQLATRVQRGWLFGSAGCELGGWGLGLGKKMEDSGWKMAGGGEGPRTTGLRDHKPAEGRVAIWHPGGVRDVFAARSGGCRCAHPPATLFQPCGLVGWRGTAGGGERSGETCNRRTPASQQQATPNILR